VTKIEYRIGDATRPAGRGSRIICHVCNDEGAWGSGFVAALSRMWADPEAAYRSWFLGGEAADFELGSVQIVRVEQGVWVANMIAQHGVGAREGAPPIRYAALRSCLTTVADVSHERLASVHMPRIGCGLAGGEWSVVERVIMETLCARDIDVTVYDLSGGGDRESVAPLGGLTARGGTRAEEIMAEGADTVGSGGLERLTGWLASAKLVRPSSDELGFAHLVRALASLGGVEDLESTPGAEALSEMIGQSDHYVFVLVDGLGAELAERLPADAFLRSSSVGTLQSVFMSTTATALTTLATGLWPCEHGIAGWWTYLGGRGVAAVTLPFIDRATRRPLAELGVPVEEVFPEPSVWPKLHHEPLAVVPAPLSDTVFARYSSGGTRRRGYETLSDAVSIAAREATRAARPSLTYVYLPQLDALCHEKGTYHEDVPALLTEIDTRIGELALGVAGRARLVVSADHGQADTPDRLRFVLEATDPMLSLLECAPTGERSVPIFHVRSGRKEEFIDTFGERFGEHYALVTPQEAEALRLFGPTDLTAVMRSRLGTLVGVPLGAAQMYVAARDGSSPRLIGVHGGLSGAEMYVPLVVT
jgi:O-acetyl-ADP-ribose deacetylase (regulator of RNase III)